MTQAAISFKNSQFFFQCQELNRNERVDIGEKKSLLFRSWIGRYNKIMKSNAAAQPLLDLGNEIRLWLYTRIGGIAILIQNSTFPLFVEFIIPPRPNSDELLFLEVSWELLADEKGHWGKQKFLFVRFAGSATSRNRPYPNVGATPRDCPLHPFTPRIPPSLSL